MFLPLSVGKVPLDEEEKEQRGEEGEGGHVRIQIRPELTSGTTSVQSSGQLPLPDVVGQVRHPLGGLRADRLQGHAARVHAFEQADSGAEQHG